MFFWFSALTRWDLFGMPFWYQLGSIFLPKIFQNPSKNWPQEGSSFWSIFDSNFYRFWTRFGSQVGAMWPTFSSQNGPRGLHDGPKASKTPQDTSPGPLQASMVIDFWLFFDRFLIVFWLIFDRFSIDFWLNFWVPFWSIWDRFLVRENLIHALSTIRLQCRGGLRPPRPPPT